MSAPLDPSKVKAGDTVTVLVLTNVPDFEMTGKAYDVGIGDRPRLSVGGWPLDDDRVTLTAHQPAPEPDRVTFLHDYLTGREDESLLDGLVVIDPAAVDVDALANRLSIGMMGLELDHQLVTDSQREMFRSNVRTTLTGIGIELP